ncbi:MAG: hypothetical protein SAL07_21950 [Oscillatoria sp. PMC 1051.18]|nr:hypothetical protein [Oscillatoria sp. PMC 1050.18]MEC5032573.1 hypothetical protein [Oscillatoria sp. PMC 1051.18]
MSLRSLELTKDYRSFVSRYQDWFEDGKCEFFYFVPLNDDEFSSYEHLCGFYPVKNKVIGRFYVTDFDGNYQVIDTKRGIKLFTFKTGMQAKLFAVLLVASEVYRVSGITWELATLIDCRVPTSKLVMFLIKELNLEEEPIDVAVEKIDSEEHY